MEDILLRAQEPKHTSAHPHKLKHHQSQIRQGKVTWYRYLESARQGSQWTGQGNWSGNHGIAQAKVDRESPGTTWTI